MSPFLSSTAVYKDRSGVAESSAVSALCIEGTTSGICKQGKQCGCILDWREFKFDVLLGYNSRSEDQCKTTLSCNVVLDEQAFNDV